MNCKKCGAKLPRAGFVCSNCQVLISKEQINNQNELNNNTFLKDGYVSEKYGGKKQLFIKREEKSFKSLGFSILLMFLLIIILIGFIVYLF